MTQRVANQTGRGLWGSLMRCAALSRHNVRIASSVFVSAGLLALLLSGGCGSQSTKPAGQPGGDTPGVGPQDPGGFGGPGGGPPGGPSPSGAMFRGPSLAKVGADPAHTPEWLAEHIRNPKSHKPDSRMPPFADKINDDDLKALVEFLASLKGDDTPPTATGSADADPLAAGKKVFAASGCARCHAGTGIAVPGPGGPGGFGPPRGDGGPPRRPDGQ